LQQIADTKTVPLIRSLRALACCKEALALVEDVDFLARNQALEVLTTIAATTCTAAILENHSSARM